MKQHTTRSAREVVIGTNQSRLSLRPAGGGDTHPFATRPSGWRLATADALADVGS
eukprot:COSAG02_NODE_51585_length_313_cov_0.728972_1_plen_54_part_10